VSSGEVQVIAEIADLPEEAGHGPAVRLDLHGLIAVPLISHDRVLGAINLYFYEAGAAATQTFRAAGAPANGPLSIPDSSTAELLKAFAAHAAVAIEHSRLHEDEIKQQRLEQELVVAKTIQQSLLPVANPEVPGWQFAATYRSARVVGGDFYDFCEVPGEQRRVGVVVADVTDKGVPAAIFMALSRTIIRTMAMSGRGPAAALQRANDLILADSPSNISVTALYAVFDVEAGRLTYANAGHIRPLLCREGEDSVDELVARGILLGAFEDIQLEEQQVEIAPGATLVFYTDGITDALNGTGEAFGDSRLAHVVTRACTGEARDILQAIMDAVAEFVGDQEQADDITCVVVKRVGER
jgi:sigma-B regulation protein RsbU (phosphoserine phosphatase)